MFSSWMSASLHVRPVFSSSPAFKFLPCIASMIKKRKEKKIAELARNPAFPPSSLHDGRLDPRQQF